MRIRFPARLKGINVHLNKLTPTQLAAHLACVHYTQLERQRRAGELSVDLSVDPRLEAMRQRGDQHEKAYLESLRHAGWTVFDLTNNKDPAATVEAMRKGYRAISQATLANPWFTGVADVLIRVDTPSALGSYSYEPLDTKLSRETKAGAILQLCTYSEMLGAMQGADPIHFRVATPKREEHFRLADFSAYYRFVRERLRVAAAATPAPQTYPDPVSHCDICAYWKVCDQRRRSDDHPSLIADIRSAHVREFQRQHIRTLAAVAQSEGHLPERPAKGSASTFLRLGHQAKLQVQARTTGMTPIDFLPVEPSRGLQRLPTPSIGDVYLDFEGDPFVGDCGLEYLTGFSARDPSGAMLFEQLWAFDSSSEKTACERFIDFVVARLQQYPDLHVYHFGSYEPSVLKRLCARYATRGEELDRLLRGGRLIDLHSVVREALRIGIERYGLKELEPLHFHKRLVDLRDAALARRDLELALELGQVALISPEMRERVAAYNRDDCLSTEALHRWVETQRSQLVERGHTLSRPPLVREQPSAEVSERDQKIETLKSALTAGLPLDPIARSPEEAGRALLASMLGYFRQEEKNGWWEFFRLRDLVPEEHLDEREMLGSMQFVEALPKQGKERNARHRYAFPAQDTAIDAGDRVFFTKADELNAEGKSTSMTVAEMDIAGGTVVFSVSKVAADRQPKSVFREQVIDSRPLETALLTLAESVLATGFSSSGPFAAACDLLLRNTPRLQQQTNGPLRRPGESALDAAMRLCAGLNHGVLPVQGPPGSGKTYVGARVIASLAGAGKKVGVTAVSHKVIDNLLEEIRDCSRQGGQTTRLIHKHDEDAPDGIEYVKTAREALGSVASHAVVGGTVWLWAADDAASILDYLFIDEAGQMSLAHALAAARSARNVVLLGDPQQLEQPIKGAHPEGADVAALVHILGRDQATLRDEQGLFLDRTYRLHPEICRFTSELYYENRLLPIDGLAQQKLGKGVAFAGSGLFLVEVEHEGNQAQSNEEVATVVSIVRHLLASGATWTNRDGRTQALQPDDVLIVAPYNAQVSALRRELSLIGVRRVGTVDKFQGQEAPVVVYSCTASSYQDAPRGMAFLYDPHRFNVATSRAQAAVIVVASPRLFEPECKTPDQMKWANGLCRYRELAKPIDSFAA